MPKRLTKEEFIEKARLVHGDKYDYSKVEYKGATTKVCIICKEHGEFWQQPSNHVTNKSQCPICNVNNKSNFEENIFNQLIKLNFTIERQKTFEWLNFKRHLYLDFYLPSLNIAVEVQGEQHFTPIDRFGGESYLEMQKLRDKTKYKLCFEHNIKLFYITKRNNNIDEIVKYIDETTNTRQIRD